MKRIGILPGIVLVSSINVFSANIDAMKPVLHKAKSGLSATLTAVDKDLTDAAKKLSAMDRKSGEARKILSAVCKDKPYAYDCAIIDMDGKLSVLEPEDTRKYEGADVSAEASVKELFKTKAPLVSMVFKALDGSSKIDFEYPIINDKGDLIGAVSLLVSYDRLLEGVLAPLMKEPPCKIWVMQTDGLCIYDPDPAQVNKNIFMDQMFQEFADLISFARLVAKEPAGTGSYSFYRKDLKDKAVLKDAIWDTVKMPANEWRIVVVEVEAHETAAKPAAQP